MTIYILRHGIAVERGTAGYKRDADRPLTPKGERRLWQITEAMERMELSFDLILSSPYLRARQTAEIVAEAFKPEKRLELCDELAADAEPKDAIRFLRALDPAPENVLLVGHEPYLSQLVSLLVAGDTGCGIELKKGGLCKLRTESLKPGRCATMEWLLTPKQMLAMG